MADEATTTTAETTAEVNADNTESVPALQGITPPSEAELSGVETPETESQDGESTEEVQDESTAETEQTATAESSEETESTEEAQPTTEDQPEKSEHPKGYVPLEALHEARGEIRYLKEKINDITDQLKAKPEEVQPETEDATPDEFKDFKILEPGELEKLVKEDPAEAILYTNKLAKYNEFQRQQTEQKAAQKYWAEKENEIITTAYERMEQVVPGIFDESKEISKELSSFAAENGFNAEMFVFTDPHTRIIPPGHKQAYPLGEGAAVILEMISKMKEFSEKAAAPVNEQEIRDQLTKEITEKVQAELLEKFKKESPTGYQPLASVEGTSTEQKDFSGKTLTMEQIGKLSEVDLQRYLSGQ